MEPLTVLPALSAALTTAKTLREMEASGESNMEDIQASITELHADLSVLAGAVADGRQREAELTDEVHRLKVELSRLRDWEKVLSEYRLESVGQGVFGLRPPTDQERSERGALVVPTLCRRRTQGGAAMHEPLRLLHVHVPTMRELDVRQRGGRKAPRGRALPSI